MSFCPDCRKLAHRCVCVPPEDEQAEVLQAQADEKSEDELRWEAEEYAAEMRMDTERERRE